MPPSAREIAEIMFANEGTGPAWGIEIIDAADGYAKLSMTIRADMLNGNRTVHGGMIFALADTAFAYACNSRNVLSVAQAASISFIDSATAGEVLVAEAVELAHKGRTGSYAVHVTTTAGRAIAEFQGLSRSTGGAVIGSAA